MSRLTLRDRLFQKIFRLTRSMTLGVRGLVINENNQVLLLRHTYTPGWYFPGGGVEKGETCELSLSRELIEEAGIQIEERAQLFGVYSNHSVFPNDHVMLYIIRTWSRTDATSTGEIAELDFFDLESLPADITPGTRRRLDEVFANEPIALHW